MGGCCSPEAPQQGADAPATAEHRPPPCAEIEVTEIVYRCDSRESCAEVAITEITNRESDGPFVSEGDGVMEDCCVEPQQVPYAGHWVHGDEVTERTDQQDNDQEAQPSPKEEGGGRELSPRAQPEPRRYDMLLTPEATSTVRASERAHDFNLPQIDHEAREEEERLRGVVRTLEWSSEELPQPLREERAPRKAPRTGRQKSAPQRVRQPSRQRGRAPEPGRQRPQRAGSRGAAAAAAPRSAASRRGSPRRSSQASEPGARRRREEGFAARRSPERRGAECTGDDLRQALRSRGALAELRANPVDNRGGPVHGARLCGAARRELPRELGKLDTLEMRLFTP